MTNVERFTGGRSPMMAAAVVGLVGLALTALGAFLPEADGQSAPRFAMEAFHGPHETYADKAVPGPHAHGGIVPGAAAGEPIEGHSTAMLSGPTHRQEALASYLVAFAYWLGIAVAALMWLAIFHTAHARWMIILRRPLETMAVVVPLFVVLFFPIAFGVEHLFVWTHDAAAVGFNKESVEMLHHKKPYLNLPFFFIRAAIYFVVWSGVGFLLHRWSTRQDEQGGVELTARQRKLSAGSLPFLAITITFAAFDWLMSLNPLWISTIFGAYYFAGSFLAAMAVLTLATTLAQRQNLWGTLVTQYHYHSLGKLLFAFTIFWAYIGFSQFMLIWISNLPEEGPWFLLRMHGAWAGVSLFLAIGHFVVPFFFLLSRDVKRKPGMLAFIAVWMLALHYVDLYWLAMPTFHPEGLRFHWTSLTAFVGVGGLAVAFAIARARGRFTVPVKDPYLNDSLRYVQP